MVPVIDLLYLEPRFRFDQAALLQTLTFAFAAGGGADAFTRVLGRPVLEPSDFNPECFTRDLFLEDFVRLCLGSRITGSTRVFNQSALQQILAQPPRDQASIELRQGILRELETNPRLCEAAEQTWLRIDRMRTMIESAALGKRSGSIQRRVEILRQLEQLILFLGSAFPGANSALGRIEQFAQAVSDSQGYQHLRQFLDYEGRLATLELSIRIGQDGEIRSLELVGARENTKSRYYRGPWSRLWSRLRMLWRGYALRENEVMGRLVEAVFDAVQAVLMNLLQLGLHLEFYLSALHLRRLAAEQGLEVCLPELVSLASPEETSSHFERLFNPFLLHEERPPVPCDLRVGASEIVIVTGPNSGGKTRLLQALGLAQVLAQAGLYVPARRARLARREGLFVSLVHDVSVDQREGQLGMELVRIRRLFERLGFGDLVLLDELCSGTNPSEGEQIAELVISLLHRLEPQAFITTHFLGFAARLQEQRPVARLAFLQVELDQRMRPAFRFVPGVAKTSLAAQTAERLGVTREALEALIAEKATKRRRQLAAGAG